MENNKLQSMGGKARALIQKEEAKRRIDEYNKNPNLCLNCNSPIIAPYNKKLRETKIKKFCCKSCVAKYNKSDRIHNPRSLLDKCSDADFLNAYNLSSDYTELACLIGYKNRINSKLKEQIIERINELGLIEYKNMTISISNMTKGELSSRRSNWQSWRSSIQKDARIVYNNSDKPKECAVCGYNKTYEVAHIKSVASFSDEILISEINDIENLVALCPNHHWEYDNDMLDIFQYIE